MARLSSDRSPCPPDALPEGPFFFCGIGGSGMLPLAMILRRRGAVVAGSDRSRDQGRSAEKFAFLEAQGIALFPQDGSGVTRADQVLVASAAIEDSVPEVGRAKALGCPQMSRAELLAALFNAAKTSIAIGGTSGKSTVTGMIGWIMEQAGRDPTIMNGAVMKNFVTPQIPFASARAGGGDVFVSEVDESDGSIALYRPTIAVLLNVSLDHKSMEELRDLFRAFVGTAETAVINLDNVEAGWMRDHARTSVTFAIASPDADIGVEAGTIEEDRTGTRCVLVDRRTNEAHRLSLAVPGRHNLSNALAAIAAASAAGVSVRTAVLAMQGFAGLARRFDVVGTSPSGITVIDDFGHNPDKVRATLRTLKQYDGRIIAFFQPHGYGPLAQMGEELAGVFAEHASAEDRVIVCDPVYFGGTTDRSVGSAQFARWIEQAGGHAEHIAERGDCGDRIVTITRPGDRVVVMGARDDTLAEFAAGLLKRLA